MLNFIYFSIDWWLYVWFFWQAAQFFFSITVIPLQYQNRWLLYSPKGTNRISSKHEFLFYWTEYHLLLQSGKSKVKSYCMIIYYLISVLEIGCWYCQDKHQFIMSVHQLQRSIENQIAYIFMVWNGANAFEQFNYLKQYVNDLR